MAIERATIVGDWMKKKQEQEEEKKRAPVPIKPWTPNPDLPPYVYRPFITPKPLQGVSTATLAAI